jgi:hypothetical protein
MHTVDEMIEILKMDLVGARVSFEIWGSLTNIENREKYEPVMQDYKTFFESTIRAQFQNIVLTLYKVFESRNDTVNFKNLIDEVRLMPTLDEDVKRELLELKNQTDSTWKKVADLRSHHFAHRTNKAKAENVYSRAGISRDKIHALMETFEKHIIKSASLRSAINLLLSLSIGLRRMI